MTKVSNKKESVRTVSTSDLLAKVAAKFDSIPKKMTKDIVSSFLAEIEESIGAQNKVRIDKVGILQVKDRAARKGRNPQTGEEIKIPASKKVSFRVASSLKEAVGVKKKKAAISNPLGPKKKK